jgi:hypothetical protein
MRKVKSSSVYKSKGFPSYETKKKTIQLKEYFLNQVLQDQYVQQIIQQMIQQMIH